MDSDWNEHVDITNSGRRRDLRDTIGPTAAAPRHASGFRAECDPDGGLFFSSGSLYVDGLHCESEAVIDCPIQPEHDGVYLFYLDVWERTITDVERPELREVALGGVSTSVRTMRMTRIRAHTPDGGGAFLSVSDAQRSYQAWLATRPGRLAAMTPNPLKTDVCAGGHTTPGGYQLPGNYLYRIEIHKSGWPGTAEFKWSRENAAQVVRVVDLQNDRVWVSAPMRDNRSRYRPGEWVELQDEIQERDGLPGVLVRIAAVGDGDPNELRLDWSTANAVPDFDLATLRLRRWDQRDALIVPAHGDWIELEGGLHVRFESDQRPFFRAGEAWWIAARALNRSIEWPCDSAGPELSAPHTGEHRFARLAFAEYQAGRWRVLADCRQEYDALATPALTIVSGDGQEANKAEYLDSPLIVRLNAGPPGARLLFEVVRGSGRLRANTPRLRYGDRLVLAPDENGFATCDWKIDVNTWMQKVRVTLLDENGDSTALSIEFHARPRLAATIAYDPPDVDTGDGLYTKRTVQAAIDQLSAAKVNRSGDTVTGPLNLESVLNVLGAAIFGDDLEVRGNLSVRGDVIAKDTEHRAGNILLGDHDSDEITLHGILKAANDSSSFLELVDALRVHEDLIVRGLLEAQGDGIRFADGTVQSTAAAGGGGIPGVFARLAATVAQSAPPGEIEDAELRVRRQSSMVIEPVRDTDSLLAISAGMIFDIARAIFAYFLEFIDVGRTEYGDGLRPGTSGGLDLSSLFSVGGFAAVARHFEFQVDTSRSFHRRMQEEFIFSVARVLGTRLLRARGVTEDSASAAIAEFLAHIDSYSNLQYFDTHSWNGSAVRAEWIEKFFAPVFGTIRLDHNFTFELKKIFFEFVRDLWGQAAALYFAEGFRTEARYNKAEADRILDFWVRQSRAFEHSGGMVWIMNEPIQDLQTVRLESGGTLTLVAAGPNPDDLRQLAIFANDEIIFAEHSGAPRCPDPVCILMPEADTRWSGLHVGGGLTAVFASPVANPNQKSMWLIDIAALRNASDRKPIVPQVVDRLLEVASTDGSTYRIGRAHANAQDVTAMVPILGASESGLWFLRGRSATGTAETVVLYDSSGEEFPLLFTMGRSEQTEAAFALYLRASQRFEANAELPSHLLCVHSDQSISLVRTADYTPIFAYAHPGAGQSVVGGLLDQVIVRTVNGFSFVPLASMLPDFAQTHAGISENIATPADAIRYYSQGSRQMITPRDFYAAGEHIAVLNSARPNASEVRFWRCFDRECIRSEDDFYFRLDLSPDHSLGVAAFLATCSIDRTEDRAPRTLIARGDGRRIDWYSPVTPRPGRQWHQVSTDADFAPRFGHSLTNVESSAASRTMWLVGGRASGEDAEFLNDVWTSYDGVRWNREPPPVDFLARSHHAAIVFRDRLYVVGGLTQDGETGDTWRCLPVRGVYWERVNREAPARSGHALAVSSDYLYLLGGKAGRQSLNDVWRFNPGMDDGEWEEVATHPVFSPRYGHSVSCLSDRYFLIGGFDAAGVPLGDVFVSENLIDWTALELATPFPERGAHAACVYAGRIWLAGGMGANGPLSDLWSSSDGIHWTRNDFAALPPRVNGALIAFRNKLWLCGGVAGDVVYNDLWCSYAT